MAGRHAVRDRWTASTSRPSRRVARRKLIGSRHPRGRLTPPAHRKPSATRPADEFPASSRSQRATSTAGERSMTASLTTPRLAGRREWIGLAVLALACLLYVMDLTVLHLAVPAISEALHPTSAQLLWIIDIYGFMVAGFLVTMGTLGDRIGRRRLLLIGAGA